MDVEARLALERLLGAAAAELLTLKRHELPAGIGSYLRRFGEQVGAARCTWFVMAPGRARVTSKHEWCRAGIVPILGASYTRAELPLSFEAFLKGNCVHVRASDPDTHPYRDLRQIVIEERICACLAVPALREGVPRGALGLDFVPTAPDFDETFVDVVRRFAQVVELAVQRLADLENESRVEARLLHKQKLESLGLLAGGIAHDFNNVLQVIQVAAEVVRDAIDPEDDDALQHLELIAQASESARDLTCRMLVFGREDLGGAEVTETSDALRRVIDMVRRLVPESVETSMLVDADLPRVPIRRGDFEQGILNLITNALHALATGGRLTVKAKAYTWAEQERVSVTVEDTGAGMTPEQLEQACEPFFTTKAPGEGTGLGLAMVRAMVDRAGGEMNIRSELGNGTTVRLDLPTVQGDLIGAVLPEPTPLPGTETILVVEDNVLVRRVAQSVLERAGYSVALAQHGVEALATLRARSDIDLVITDAIMPRMGGRALYEEAHRRGLRMPFLFCTGYSANTLDGAFLQRSGCELLEKPWKPEQLLARVRHMLDASRDYLAG